MKLIFIGTGSGKTSLTRFHSSLLFQTDEGNVLIDAGDGIPRALKTRDINYNSIDAIIFSHYHADHFGGIASLITQMYLINRKNPLRIFTNPKQINPLVSYLHSTYLFEDKLGFTIDYVEYDFEKTNTVFKNFSFETKKNNHVKLQQDGVNREKVNFISSSFLFNCHGKKIFYTSDIGSNEDLYLFKNHKIDYFISEATHISGEEIYRSFLESGAEKLYLTHIDEDIKELGLWYEKLDSKHKIKSYNGC